MTAKAEALDALSRMLARLREDKPLDGYDRAMFAAATSYAHEQVEKIAEVKRARKAKVATT